MAWRVEYIPATGFIEVTYSDQVVVSDLLAAATKRSAVQEETGSKLILVDSSDAEACLSIVDVYNLPEKLYFEQMTDTNTAIALVLPQSDEAKQFAYFYETASVNRGWRVKVFQTREEAMEWLREQ